MKPDEVDILVAVLGFALALIIFWIDQKDKGRHRRVLGILFVLLVIGIPLGLWLRASRPTVTPSPGKVASKEPDPPSERGTDSVSAPRDSASVTPPEPAEPVPPYHGWLRREGALIRYHAAVYMPGSCPGRIMAVGDFGPGGWTSGPEARCEADGWITFDAGQLLEEPRFVPGHTYCLNFVDDRGRYGQHGAPPRAPGLSEIEVPAKEGAQAGLTIGFRVVRSASGAAVEFTNEGIPHCE